jgi:hypothetical protein
MRQPWRVIGWLPLVWLTACVGSPPAGLTYGPIHPAVDRLLTQGEIQVAEAHLKDFGFDPGPIDGLFTAETQAAVRAFQARYGYTVTGELDDATRRQLLRGLVFPHAAR